MKTEKQENRERETVGFIQGVGYAIARLADFGEPTLASQIMDEVGYTYADYAEVCDEADLPILRKVWDEN